MGFSVGFAGDENWQDTWLIDVLLLGVKGNAAFPRDDPLTVIPGRVALVQKMADARHPIFETAKRGRPHVVFFLTTSRKNPRADPHVRRALERGVPVYQITRVQP